MTIVISMAERPLERSELISIADKDEEYYNNWVGNDLQELAQRYLGVRTWIKYRNAITVLSRFGYFISSDPTPGEEFCGAEATSVNPVRRLLTILLNNELKLPSEIPKYYLEIMKDMNVITFLLFGDFYQLPKRITNYFYRTGGTTSYQSKKMSYLYKVIAFMSILRLFLNISKRIESESSPQHKPGDGDVSKSSSSKQRRDFSRGERSKSLCQLCSEARIEPTSTICGHIFCWQCIHRWLRERSECPICRTPTEPSRLIHLINFR